MGNGIYQAVSGSIGQMRNLDVLANNLAHVNTPGFKADVVLFENKLSDADGGRHTVDTPRTAIRMSQGLVAKTDNPLDLAISGDGFFVVESDKGTRLTRTGRLQIGDDRMLRTTAGNLVHGESGFIRIPSPAELEHQGPIAIDSKGNITIGSMHIDQLKRVKAPVESLRKAGSDSFSSTVPIGQLPKEEGGEVLQGHLEGANVNPVVAMTQIINVQRTFEALQRVVKTCREVDAQSMRRAR
jgi:flagellar basal body rod protein FlgG